MTQLNKKIIIEGTIKTLTGLHIGGTNSSMGIGGPDSMVVRNPIDNKPYIPGSSLKGKLRSLLEVADGTISVSTDRRGNKSYSVASEHDAHSSKLFGTIQKDDKQRPSKLIVRDGKLVSNEDLFKNTDLPYTESKTEVVIDRITAKAMPRQLERVPAGAEFELNMVLNIFNEDDEAKQISNLERAMKLLQDDYIGGSGSRGYGQIKFENVKAKVRDMEYYQNNSKETELANYFNDFK